MTDDPKHALCAWPGAGHLSQSTVSRIWPAFGLQPHRTETFKLSTDPYFVDKVHDVVGLYPDPPERGVGVPRG
jgi:hypothetical protein